MSAPEIRVAVRDKNGKPHLLKVLDDDVQTHEQAIELARYEFPSAQAVLASVPSIAAEVEEVTA